MADVRTVERELLVEARDIVGGVIYSIAEGTGSQITLHEAKVLRNALASGERRKREPGGWAPIASIIEDGYDVGEDSETIARAVHAYVTEGAPNPFEEEADRLHCCEYRAQGKAYHDPACKLGPGLPVQPTEPTP